MVKWADYNVSAVRYNNQHTHIDKVRVHEDDGGDTLGKAEEWLRSEVVSALELGTTFVTIIKNKTTNKYEEGQDIHIVTVNGTKYIHTDKDQTAADNLENLPEF